VAALACSLAWAAGPLGPFGNATAIDAGRLRAHLEFVASDLMQGRDTPSVGLDITAAYLAANLKRIGLQPAGSDGFYQYFDLVARVLDESASKVTVGGQSFAFGDGFLGRGAPGSGSGQAVYVAGTAEDPLGGADVAGKVVVASDPGRRAQQALVEAVAAKGGTALVLVPTQFGLNSWAGSVSANRNPRYAMASDAAAAPGLPVVLASKALLQAICGGTSMTADELLRRAEAREAGAAVALASDVSVAVAFKQSVRRTQNVVAVWPGSDPKLKGEYVAVGAHYDHVGVRNVPEGQDGLYNGADDDGSGTVALLEMAEVFASNPKPKRSILFVWHSGEEKGLWGSGHFTDNPTVPIGQIVAQINIDMIGRSRTAADTPERFPQMTGPDEVHVVGSRMISDELGDVLVSVNSKLHKLTFNAHYDRPNDPERIYFRSDHYNYARKGIPIAFFFSGIHADYHGVDDEVDRIDFRKLERVTETVYATLWELATRAGRPKPKAGASQ
jgi:hypothetical protein